MANSPAPSKEEEARLALVAILEKESLRSLGKRWKVSKTHLMDMAAGERPLNDAVLEKLGYAVVVVKVKERA